MYERYTGPDAVAEHASKKEFKAMLYVILYTSHLTNAQFFASTSSLSNSCGSEYTDTVNSKQIVAHINPKATKIAEFVEGPGSFAGTTSTDASSKLSAKL